MAEVKVFETDCDHCIPQSFNQAHIWYIFAEGNKHYLLRADNTNCHKVIRITKVSKKSLAIHIEGGGHRESVDTTAITWIDSKYQHICKEAMLSDQYVQYFNTQMTLLQKPLITAYCFIEDNLTLIDSHSCILPIHTISTSISSTTSITNITDIVPYTTYINDKNIEKDTLLLSLLHRYTKNKCISFEFKLKCGFVSHVPISQIHADSYHSNHLNQNISNNDININDIQECTQESVIDEHDNGIETVILDKNETLSKLLSDNKNSNIQTRHTTNDMNHLITQDKSKLMTKNSNIQYRYHRYTIHQLSKYHTLTYQHHDVRWGQMSHLSIYNPCDFFRCIFNCMKSNCNGYNDENKEQEHQDRYGSMNKCHAYDIRNTDGQSIQSNSKTRTTSVMYPYKYCLDEITVRMKECLYTLMNNPQNNMKISFNSNHIHGWDKYDMNSVSTCVTDFFHGIIITTSDLNSHLISMYKKSDLVTSSDHSQSKTMQLLPNIIATSPVYPDDGHTTTEHSSGSNSKNSDNNSVNDQYNNNDGSDKTNKTIPHSYTSIPTQHTSSPPSLLPNIISILSYLLHTEETDVLDSILMLQALDMLDAEGLNVLYNHILVLMGTSNSSNMDESFFNIDHLNDIQSTHTSSTSISQESQVDESHTTCILPRHPTTNTNTNTTTDEIEALLFAYIQSHPSIDTSLKPLLRVMAMYKLYLSDMTSSSLSDLLCNEDNLYVYNGLTKQDNPITSSGNSHSHIHIHTVQMSYNDKDNGNHILSWTEFYHLYSQDVFTSSNNDNMLDYDENPTLNHQANILYQMMSFSIHRYMTSTEIHESHIAYVQYIHSLQLQDCLILFHGWLISLNAKDISLIITLQNIDSNNIPTNINDSKEYSNVYKTTTNNNTTTTTATTTTESNEPSIVDSISIIYKQNDTSPGVLRYSTQSILSFPTTNTTATTNTATITTNSTNTATNTTNSTNTATNSTNTATNTTNSTNTATNTTNSTNTATNTTNTAMNTTNTTNSTNTATNTTNTAMNTTQIHDDNIIVGLSADTIDTDTDTDTSAHYSQDASTIHTDTHTHSQNTIIPIKNTHYILYQLKAIDIDGKPVNKVTQKLVDDSRIYEEAAYMEQQLLLLRKEGRKVDRKKSRLENDIMSYS